MTRRRYTLTDSVKALAATGAVAIALAWLVSCGLTRAKANADGWHDSGGAASNQVWPASNAWSWGGQITNVVTNSHGEVITNRVNEPLFLATDLWAVARTYTLTNWTSSSNYSVETQRWFDFVTLDPTNTNRAVTATFTWYNVGQGDGISNFWRSNISATMTTTGAVVTNLHMQPLDLMAYELFKAWEERWVVLHTNAMPEAFGTYGELGYSRPRFFAYARDNLVALKYWLKHYCGSWVDTSLLTNGTLNDYFADTNNTGDLALSLTSMLTRANLPSNYFDWTPYRQLNGAGPPDHRNQTNTWRMEPRNGDMPGHAVDWLGVWHDSMTNPWVATTVACSNWFFEDTGENYPGWLDALDAWEIGGEVGPQPQYTASWDTVWTYDWHTNLTGVFTNGQIVTAVVGVNTNIAEGTNNLGQPWTSLDYGFQGTHDILTQLTMTARSFAWRADTNANNETNMWAGSLALAWWGGDGSTWAATKASIEGPVSSNNNAWQGFCDSAAGPGRSAAGAFIAPNEYDGAIQHSIGWLGATNIVSAKTNQAEVRVYFRTRGAGYWMDEYPEGWSNVVNIVTNDGDNVITSTNVVEQMVTNYNGAGTLWLMFGSSPASNLPVWCEEPVVSSGVNRRGYGVLWQDTPMLIFDWASTNVTNGFKYK